MTEEERKAKATEIVVKILKLLEEENLTTGDARRILEETECAIMQPVYEGMAAAPVAVSEDFKWRKAFLPQFPPCPAK